MGCKLELERPVQKLLQRLQDDVAERIKKRMERLAENPICEKKLKGRLKGYCRSRIGEYRIIYRLLPCHVIVVRIGDDPLLALLRASFPASPGGSRPPPSGLSDLRSEAHTSPFQHPHPRGITFFSWRGPACLGGNNPLGTVHLYFNPSLYISILCLNKLSLPSPP
jgi:mRNA-degrading endonuclease RelE of RelBE toxin-antitoxin system